MGQRRRGRDSSALLTDLYQLNMLQAYLDHGRTETAVFELFFRKLPPKRGFLLAAGLEQALEFLEALAFDEEEIDWLRRSGRFGRDFLDYLAAFRFRGDVHALPEGRAFFADEPVIRVTASLPEAQLVESRLINLLHFQTLVASKAARMVLAAPGKQLIDFGMRRAHGAEAALLAARAAYLAGFEGSATMLAESAFGIPAFGTMAHSFVQAWEEESAAFLAFARSRPRNLTLLIDTYDTESGARKAVTVAGRLREEGIALSAVRLDSGDLGLLSKKVRAILDQGGLREVKIFASGGLDEDAIEGLLGSGAPIDGFGVGTSLTTSFDLPALDCAYKLQEYAGVARRKLSTGKATWPGRKQVFRHYDEQGRMAGDCLTLEDDAQPGEALIQPVMQAGKRLPGQATLDQARALAAGELARLPDSLRSLRPQAPYPVRIAPALTDLAAEVDRRLRR